MSEENNVAMETVTTNQDEMSLAKDNSLPIKGHLIWFECSVNGLTKEKAEELCNKHGIDFKAFPKLTKKKALVTAVRDLESKVPGVIARQISSTNNDHLLYAIVKESNKQSLYDRQASAVDGKADYDIDNCVVYDRANDTVLFKFEDDKLKEKVAHFLGTYTTSDIRRMIIKVFSDIHVEQMRKNGGVYFAPNTPEAQDSIKRLKGLLDEIPGDCSLHFSEVLDSDHIKESLVYYMKDRILGETQEFIDHINKVDLNRRREYLLTQMQTNYKKLEEKIQVYGVIFELLDEKLKQKMDEAKQAFLGRLDEDPNDQVEA